MQTRYYTTLVAHALTNYRKCSSFRFQSHHLYTQNGFLMYLISQHVNVYFILTVFLVNLSYLRFSCSAPACYCSHGSMMMMVWYTMENFCYFVTNSFKQRLNWNSGYEWKHVNWKYPPMVGCEHWTNTEEQWFMFLMFWMKG